MCVVKENAYADFYVHTEVGAVVKGVLLISFYILNLLVEKLLRILIRSTWKCFYLFTLNENMETRPFFTQETWKTAAPTISARPYSYWGVDSVTKSPSMSLTLHFCKLVKVDKTTIVIACKMLARYPQGLYALAAANDLHGRKNSW